MWVDYIRQLVAVSDDVILWYFVGLNSVYALLLLFSVPEILKHWEVHREDDLSAYVGSDALPAISVIVPAYNMEASIRDNVECLLALRYALHEVIVVNDGSKDSTMDELRDAFDLYEIPPIFPPRIPTQRVRAYYRSHKRPRLVVIDKLNGGKADALNAGLCAARFPLLLAVDADTLIEHDALTRLARTFLLDPNVAAAGATIRVVNDCEIVHRQVSRARVPSKLLPGVQVPEYLRAFLFGRLGWNRLGGSLIVSGAFGVFQRKYLLQIGGYKVGTVVEDLDLVIRIHKHLRHRGVKYSIPFIPDPVAWTEVPSDTKTLGRQRERWHRGLVTTMWDHIGMMFNPRYGVLGMFTVPFFFFGEMLAPVIEMYGLIIVPLSYALGVLNLPYAIMFFAAAWGFGMLVTLTSVLMEELTFRRYPGMQDFRRMLFYSLVEPFGYRQLTVFWRLRGFVNAVRGTQSWGVMQRKGFAVARCLVLASPLILSPMTIQAQEHTGRTLGFSVRRGVDVEEDERARQRLDAVVPRGANEASKRAPASFEGGAGASDEGIAKRAQEPAARESVDSASVVEYRASLEQRLQTFDQDFSSWRQTTVALERKDERGTIIGRTSYYNRFHKSAVLFEVDAYPKLGKRSYGYFSAGVSTNKILPEYRFAGEIYRSLPLQMEASLGMRRVRFDSSVTVYTGTLGMYRGNNWFEFRPSLITKSGNSTQSWSLRARRYFSDPDEYVTLSLVTGSSLETDTASFALFELDTNTAQLELRKRVSPNYIGRMLLGYENQELPGRSDRDSLIIGLGLEYRF